MPRVPSRSSEVPWSPAEDQLLKSLIERYPSNWRLVADALNSSTIRTCIDLRTPQECFERWRMRLTNYGRHTGQPSSSAGVYPADENTGMVPPPSATSDAPPPTPSVSTSQMTTRGIKRAATNAAQNASSGLTVNTGTNSVEVRKRRRHIIINDAIRKQIRKRDNHLRNAGMCLRFLPLSISFRVFIFMLLFSSCSWSSVKWEESGGACARYAPTITSFT